MRILFHIVPIEIFVFVEESQSRCKVIACNHAVFHPRGLFGDNHVLTGMHLPDSHFVQKKPLIAIY
jgi:hypothetical protein